MQKEEGPLQLKIVFTGDMGVGKTTLISFIALGLQMV
jgi:GTPase SAR1 family protein